MFVKCKVTRRFTFERFKLLKNIVRSNPLDNQNKTLYVNDIFECDIDIGLYLNGDNPDKRSYVNIIGIFK